MAKIQLDIDSRANMEAFNKAQAELERLELSGKSVNQVFKSTGNMKAYEAALTVSYESARMFGNQLKATRVAVGDVDKAMKSAQAFLGKDKKNVITYIDEKGVEQQTRDLAVLEKALRSHMEQALLDAQNFQQSMTRQLGEFKGFEAFNKDLDRTADAYKNMGNEIGAVQFKMKAIEQQILDMTAKRADADEIKKLSDEYKRLTAEHKNLSDAANGTSNRIKNLLWNFVSAQAIVWALRKTLSLLTTGLKESSKAAAEAEQVFGRFDAVFEGLERANAALSEMVDNFGVAKSSAADIISSIGGIAIGFGASAMEAAEFAEKVAGSLSDIMAFRDVSGSITDFAQSFMSGAAGNVQNFRAISSVVRATNVDLELQKQGWQNLTGQQLEWAKVQARVNIVLDQQRKAMGATEREWDTMLSIQRRHQEQNKQLKENIGETINKYFKPMSEWILTLKENWNAAHEAKNNYDEGVYNPNDEFENTPAARILEKEITAYRNMQSKLIADTRGRFGSFNIDEFEIIEDWGKRYGATLRDTAEIAEAVGLVINQSVWDQVDAYDAAVKAANDLKRADSDRLAKLAADAQIREDFNTALGAAMGLGRSAKMSDVPTFIAKDASTFITPLERLLGFDEGRKGEMEAKIKSFSSMIEMLFNESISSSDEKVRDWATQALGQLVPALKKAKQQITALETEATYDKSVSGVEDEIALLQMRNNLVAVHGEKNIEIVNLKAQQWLDEKNAYELYQQRLESTDDEVQSLQEYNDLMRLITEQYDMQLDIIKKQNDERIRAERETALSDASKTIAGVRTQRRLIGVTDLQRAFADIDVQVWDFAETLARANVDFATMFDQTAKYRKELEMLAAEESYQAVVDGLKSHFKSIGDIGMVEGWVDLFKTVKEAMLAEGKDEDEATIKAWGSTWIEIILEFASRLEVINELFSMVSEIFDELAPIVDSFLRPFLAIIGPILNLLKIFIPILTILFPIVKVIAVAFASAAAWVEFFVNAIRYAIGRLTWWTRSDDIDWNKDVMGTLNQRLDEVNAIWDMEIEAREDFVDKLTDAQKGQLDAYNEMFKSGLLTLEQYQAKIGKHVYGRNFDNVGIESFAKGGEFITSGEKIIRVGEAGREHVKITPLNSTNYIERNSQVVGGSSYSVVVNGGSGDPEEIAMAVRREFRRMERRGVKYA